MRTQVEITETSIVSAATQQVSADLAGEAAILDLKSGVYYGLNTVGAFVWSLIQKPKKVSEIWDAVLLEFEVERERCKQDVLILLRKLAAEGLIEVADVPAK